MSFNVIINLPISGKSVRITEINKFNHVLGMLRGEDHGELVAKTLATCVIRDCFPEFEYGSIASPETLHRRMELHGLETFTRELAAYAIEEKTLHYAGHAESAFDQLRMIASEEDDHEYFDSLRRVWLDVMRIIRGDDDYLPLLRLSMKRVFDNVSEVVAARKKTVEINVSKVD